MAKTLDAAGVKRLIHEIKGANKNLNTPIPISTENTTESMAQNVKNIADYVAKAKAAGIANVNGMAVTCLLIEEDYSGVGYLYGDTTNVTVCGIMLTDDAIDGKFFSIQSTGEYHYNFIISSGDGNVDSGLLDKGARKPIILTPSTTEVDEETYQKLLSDNVDVVFYDATEVFNILYDRVISETTITLTFVSVTCSDTTDASSYVFSRFPIVIDKAAPHTLQVSGPAENNLEEILNDSNYLNKSTLSPVLQEIDLTGTDADRKAKLDQFEMDWKALTGANDILGARFVGDMGTPNGELSTIFAWNSTSSFYEGVGTDDVEKIYKIQVDPSDGNIHFTPLFSHLEAITIRTGNTPDDKAANVAAINAYVDNLTALGVDTTKGFNIPVNFDNNQSGFIAQGVNGNYVGYNANINLFGGGFIVINSDGTYTALGLLTVGAYSNLTTTSKYIVSAINEVNALVEKKADKSLNAKSLESITIKTGNTPDDKAANVAAIKAYVDNLIALGVDVTKGYMIPVKLDNGYHGFIMGTGADGGHTGIIKRDTYNYGGGWIFINNIGTYQYLECLTLGSYDNLTTTAKTIVPAINEVNALAKGYSTIFTPIELTTETAQNKTAIDARVAAFTAQGISLTNGCCIPVVYKGVYAGNISLINGDWYGLLVKNTNNPADNINIKLSADGTITEGNSVQ